MICQICHLIFLVCLFVCLLVYNLMLVQGKKGVWIKLPIERVNLIEAAVKVKLLLISSSIYAFVIILLLALVERILLSYPILVL